MSQRKIFVVRNIFLGFLLEKQPLLEEVFLIFFYIWDLYNINNLLFCPFFLNFLLIFLNQFFFQFSTGRRLLPALPLRVDRRGVGHSAGRRAGPGGGPVLGTPGPTAGNLQGLERSKITYLVITN